MQAKQLFVSLPPQIKCFVRHGDRSVGSGKKSNTKKEKKTWPHAPPPQKSLGSLHLLLASPSACLVSGGLRAGMRWIPALVGRRAPFLDVSSSYVRVCVLLRKARRRHLPEDGIKFSSHSSYPGCASSIVGGRMDVFGGSVFDGFSRIWSSFVYIHVSSGLILPIYAILHRRQLLFWCTDLIRP